MKKYIAFILLVLATSAAFAQHQLSVDDLNVVRTGNRVEISFRAVAHLVPFKLNTTYTFAPCLLSGDHRHALPPIVFGSKRVHILNQRRHISNVHLRYRGDTVSYRFSLPYEAWMDKSLLVVEPTVKGCCRTSSLAPILLSKALLPAPVVAQTPPVASQAPVVAQSPAASVGKQLAEKYAFVSPCSELTGTDGTSQEQRSIDHYLSRHEEGALQVLFAQGSSALDLHFGNNSTALHELVQVISAINSSKDSKVSHVVIAGFTSPEGSLAVNDRLGWGRAVALQEYLKLNAPVEPERVHLYNGSENWMALRKLVADSQIEYRDEILRIIDTVPVAQGREKRLMGLGGGTPYRYMLRHYFPQLRQAAYIRVYYQDMPTNK